MSDKEICVPGDADIADHAVVEFLPLEMQS